MKYHVLITNPEGATVRHDLDPVSPPEWYDGGEEGFHEFMWSDGNYACDCNRDLFFQRGMGVAEEDIDWNGVQCGNTYYHVKLCREDGTVFYED